MGYQTVGRWRDRFCESLGGRNRFFDRLFGCPGSGESLAPRERHCIRNRPSPSYSALQRGWLGVFVTTGTFTKQAQVELDVDGYPIVLINGQGVAQVLQKEMTATGLALDMLFEREANWYSSNLSSLPAENILHNRRAGHELWHMD